MFSLYYSQGIYRTEEIKLQAIMGSRATCELLCLWDNKLLLYMLLFYTCNISITWVPYFAKIIPTLRNTDFTAKLLRRLRIVKITIRPQNWIVVILVLQLTRFFILRYFTILYAHEIRRSVSSSSLWWPHYNEHLMHIFRHLLLGLVP